MSFCANCGREIGNNRFCTNCGAPQNQHQTVQPIVIQQTVVPPPKPIYKRVWFWVLIVICFLGFLTIISPDEPSKTPEEASKNLNEKIAVTLKPTTQETPANKVEPSQDDVPTEINPDIPLGSTYELGQGKYVCGEDIPAGRYTVEWVEGNQFGGHITAQNGAKYFGTSISIEPQEPYTCILSAGDTFEISLASMRFTKITSLPNEMYLQTDGSYLLGAGFFFEGIDIPEGKYNVTAVGGNQFGIRITTSNKSFIFLDQNETYSNLTLNHSGATIEISLGQALFEPVG